MSDCEIAYSSFDKPTRIFTLNRAALRKEGTIHPTQKPIDLYRWIFSNYAKEGYRIIDTHLGSGSSRIAAFELGLEFVGYEIDKDYFDAQEARFERYSNQVSMFP